MKRALLMMAVGLAGAGALWLGEGCTIYSEPPPNNAATPPPPPAEQVPPPPVEQPPPVVVQPPPQPYQPPPQPYQPPPQPYQPPPQPYQPPPTVVAPPTGTRSSSPGITVLAATYGANLGLPRGNVTQQLAGACNGRRECEYRVDFHVLGDPAYGRQKNFVAEWQCGNSPEVRRAEAAAEAGFGSTIQLRCGGPYYPPPVVEQPPPPQYIPPPVVAPATIQVVSGSYGMSCGVPRGNVTGALQQGCNGKSRCDYRVDFHVLGDPAYGCQKDYVAEWRCSNSPQLYRAVAEREAGFGKVVTLACDGSAQPAPPPGPPTGVSGIRVRWATYGANCNPALRGNATAAVQQSCDGRAQCEYRVDFHVLGDPANGCAKEFRTEWTCDNSPGERRAAAPAEAGFGSVVSLRCP